MDTFYAVAVVSPSDLHFFETKKYIQFFKQINIIYVITNYQKIKTEKKVERINIKLVISISQCHSVKLEKTR